MWFSQLATKLFLVFPVLKRYQSQLGNVIQKRVVGGGLWLSPLQAERPGQNPNLGLQLSPLHIISHMQAVSSQ